MEQNRRKFALALLCSLVTLLATPARPVNAAPTYTYRTRHYEVTTDMGLEMAQLVARHMEEMFKNYKGRFGSYSAVHRQFDVHVYRQERDYMADLPNGAWGSTGVFLPQERMLAAHADGRTTEEILRTLYHEGFHQFMYEAVSEDPPAWINEGVAEYFSEATWNGREFETGLVPTKRLHIIQTAIENADHVPFRRMLRMMRAEWNQTMSTDRRRADLHYCQAWSMVQFLAHADGGRYAGMLDDYIRHVSRGDSPEEAAEAVFGKDIEGFEKTWADYVRGLEPSPKFTCRDNMEALMLLAKGIYEDPRQFSDVGELRHRLLNRGYTWRITRPTGETLSSEDRSQVVALFHCPLDRDGHGISYFMVQNSQRMPFLICMEHPGVVIVAQFKRRQNGEMAVEIEEQVREMLSPGLRRAIRAARR